MENNLFLISIIFQVSGAVVLLLNSLFHTREKAIYEYCAGTRGIMVENGKVGIDKKHMTDILHGIYLSRSAFLYLIIGYLTTVLSSNEMSKVVGNLIIIFVSCLLLTIITYLLLYYVAKKRASSPKYCEIDAGDVPVGSTTFKVTK